MKVRIALLIFMLLAGGCASQLPIAKNHPISTQKKARAAHHWDVLADDVAEQTFLVTLGKESSLKGKTFYIQPIQENIVFNKAFRNFLITRMVNRGMPVSEKKDGAVEIRYETQLVRHNSSRYTHIPGTFTALTAGLWVVRDMITSGALQGAAGLAALADYGMGHYAGGPTHTELIVSTSIVMDSGYVLRKSDIYYIEDADTDLFIEASERPVKQWQVIGK
ncbi:MAG: hypothetical protein FD174_1089 [Geobacteraceae bacterium]|nr:MAG: hypothetical protein FD174_1089 [Geobacteraceae bacterium]